MLRLAAARAAPGGGGHGQHCNCNELPVGSIFGVPIRVSIFLLFYALWSTAGMAGKHAPWWVVVCIVLGGLALLVITILVHEFGHGLTARHLGGDIHHILLWPFGGLCVHSMPEHVPLREKLWNDWWVTFNGPVTHLVMTPIWIGITALCFLCFHIRYSSADLWSDLNPVNHSGSLTRHPEVMKHGWGAVVLLQLCATAITFNVLLFLFNLLFPMYPMDSSKLLVTGMQLCGTPVQKAAWRFIYVSGACVATLGCFGIYLIYRWIAASQGSASLNHGLTRLGFGIIPIPLPIVLTVGLTMYGARQTWTLYGLADTKRLHTHPLFSHVERTSRMVRDIAGGRPDVMVERWMDKYNGNGVDAPGGPQPPAPPAPPQPPDYGAVRIVDGRIVRG